VGSSRGEEHWVLGGRGACEKRNTNHYLTPSQTPSFLSWKANNESDFSLVLMSSSKQKRAKLFNTAPWCLT